MSNVSVGIVDDHKMLLKPMTLLVNSFNGFEAVLVAEDGIVLLNKLKAMEKVPDIILMDISMPNMNGFEAAKQLRDEYPAIKVIALSSLEDDLSILKMFRAGCRAYIQKFSPPEELEKALIEVATTGMYNADLNTLNPNKPKAMNIPHLTSRESEFLKLACSELTYKEIASIMSVAERTVDGYRQELFEKMQVKSRVGMALEAIRLGFITIKT